ncbi:hypothetical protein IWW55_000324 [Coemansia sp. RSA 2706]|nr:hypothetical protein IWW55_000324 [Coemansia sp. RSA 2706]KAJ2314786.1 hypothetical protein IWW54_000710 [Coemansia sp. RSA 2705]KAJ2321487.1 hypothetical protein IWW52_000717 [Coemansia sp. RSA 2704]KAJ2329957.1 hypothetical protein IWW51_000271 [Coemansia sp. RSA 2702]KAJ2369325.1 hypothetical protein H4S01_001070 [Coemansia sp. RSA 2610]KAJ2392573.1 hypothetical protein H4S02_000709 [Coemansia sp. RSA 2611]KAJ2739623.1 hypothetical protein H4R23_000333 [Coemansia sp. Cherry 401B]
MLATAVRRLASQTFAEGDMVIVRECARGGKAALIGPLFPSDHYATKRGNIAHSQIIGQQARSRVSAQVRAGTGGQYMVQHPTLDEYVRLCKRQCTPIYPKDASAVVAMLDLQPGDRVLEAGTGNAGLTMHMARAVGAQGRVHTVERNQATADHAQLLVQRFQRGVLLPTIAFYQGRKLGDAIGEIAESIDPDLRDKLAACGNDDPEALWRQHGSLVAPLFDAVALDMPMPWTELPRVFGFLKTDRFAVCYLPSITQVAELVRSCARWPLLVEDVVEVQWRAWDVRPAAVRSPDPAAAPGDDAMVCRPTHTPTGHTAFLVRLRKCAASVAPIERDIEQIEPK